MRPGARRPQNVVGIEINPGAYTIYSSTLNDARKELLEKGVPFDSALPGALQMWKEQDDKVKKTHEEANFLTMLGRVSAGRGVVKSQYTPAQQGSNLWPMYPRYFNIEQRDPIPYQRVYQNGQNLVNVMQGSPASENDRDNVAKVMQHVNMRKQMINASFNRQVADSIYSDVPKDASRNLYEMKVRQIRENSLFALY